ncbi:MAG: ATPase, partial [Candidatus Aenigmarchaeota archaeon]|nr:ATPase [Candidatus Aenigmarchaeota archaeon]
VIDTIIYIKDGQIKTVYTLKLTVRVPSGMTEQDLARPVVDVLDFEGGELVYEMYTYGEQTVVIPVVDKKFESGVNRLAEEQLKKLLKKHIPNPIIEIVSKDSAIVRVTQEEIPYVIGKNGTNIAKLEGLVGMKLSVEPIISTLKKEIGFDIFESGGYVVITLSKKYTNHTVDVCRGEDYLFSATVGKKAQIKVKKKSDIGRSVLKAAAMKSLKVLAD